ncbi:response regulator [Desulfogranum japonicum]|uniref:response regulator n=1 Tax=Desulfogranum japonicum TaxID=231447 RepID=UPI00041027CE|nr:HD domain-containing phosphohydrolase [Desulfogranum japonicum]
MDRYTTSSIVLVIEDEPTQRKLLQKQLEQTGFTIIVANNAREGIAAWRENKAKIRIIITDLLMPDISGLTVIDTIRAEEMNYTYIMALTQSRNKDDLINVLTHGADDYVPKPVVPAELKLRMQAALKILRLQDYNILISGLAELAAERSGESANHLNRIKRYSYILAKEMGSTCNDLDTRLTLAEDIANLSVLHDIGKNSLPDGLLNKRTKYTAREFAMYKEHTVIGGNILLKLHQETGSPYLLMGYEIAMYHHEHWDGSGYPQGLKGNEIPLPARIVGFADVYDSMLSRKPYKDALPLSYVEEVIETQKGKRFAPEVVEAYQKLREQLICIRKEIPDRDIF